MAACRQVLSHFAVEKTEARGVGVGIFYPVAYRSMADLGHQLFLPSLGFYFYYVFPFS